KKKKAEDVLTIFSNCCTVKFYHLDGKEETLCSCWCNKCKKDDEFLAKNLRQKAFHVESNLSCCQHIWSHYDLYRAHCAAKKVPENHYAVPQEMLKAKQEAKKWAK
ncbi:hypothetical protein PAXRUDRAFT_62771, partial [Paxillus rubicundulus Ve08.2h10]